MTVTSTGTMLAAPRARQTSKAFTTEAASQQKLGPRWGQESLTLIAGLKLRERRLSGLVYAPQKRGLEIEGR
jgi:hypothetical protein